MTGVQGQPPGRSKPPCPENYNSRHAARRQQPSAAIGCALPAPAPRVAAERQGAAFTVQPAGRAGQGRAARGHGSGRGAAGARGPSGAAVGSCPAGQGLQLGGAREAAAAAAADTLFPGSGERGATPGGGQLGMHAGRLGGVGMRSWGRGARHIPVELGDLAVIVPKAGGQGGYMCSQPGGMGAVLENTCHPVLGCFESCWGRGRRRREFGGRKKGTKGWPVFMPLACCAPKATAFCPPLPLHFYFSSLAPCRNALAGNQFVCRQNRPLLA